MDEQQVNVSVDEIREMDLSKPIAIEIISKQPLNLQQLALNFPKEVIDHDLPEKPRVIQQKVAPVVIIENETSE